MFHLTASINQNATKMENQNEIKISIPKPCHEDWNKMTPNEKGSFCGKCCKTVVDFTNKSAEEIKNTLITESGKKVCGRFMSNQLDEKPKSTFNLNIPLYLLPKNISYRKAFAIALFFAFGTSLFSCRTTEDHIVGDIAIIETTNNDTTKIVKQIVIDTLEKGTERICEPVNGNIAIERTQGEVMIQDTIKNITDDDVLINEPKMGKVKIDN